MPAAAPTLPLEWIFRPLLLWVSSPGFKVWGDYVWLEDTSPYLVANEAGETILLCFLTLYKALPSTKTQEVSQYKEENQRWEMASWSKNRDWTQGSTIERHTPTCTELICSFIDILNLFWKFLKLPSPVLGRGGRWIKRSHVCALFFFFPAVKTQATAVKDQNPDLVCVLKKLITWLWRKKGLQWS